MKENKIKKEFSICYCIDCDNWYTKTDRTNLACPICIKTILEGWDEYNNKN